MSKRKVSRASGFTLVEVLVVVVLLGIMAALVIPGFDGVNDQAQASAVTTDLRQARQAIEMYKIGRHESPPLLVDGFDPLVNAGVLRRAPVNPRTQSATIVAGDGHLAGNDTVGWIYDATSSDLWAQFWNENINEWDGP